MGIYQSIVVPTLLYGCEAWVLNVAMRRTLETAKVSCLRVMCGGDMQKIQSLEIRWCRVTKSIIQRITKLLFGNLERLEKNRMNRRAHKSGVEGRRSKIIPGKVVWRGKGGFEC